MLINNNKFGGGQSEMSTAGGHQQQQQQPSTFTGAFQSQQGTSMQPNPMRVINTRPGGSGGFGNQSQTPQFGSQPTTGIQGGSLFGSAPPSAQQQAGQMLASAQRQQIASTTPNIPSDTRVLIRGARFNQAGQGQQQQQQQPQAPSIIQQSQFSLQQQHQQIPQTMQFQQQGQLNQAQQLQQNQQQMRRSMGGMPRGGGAAGSTGGQSQPQPGAGPGRGRNF